MNISVDISYKSLNKHHEELCGDKVEMLTTKDSQIIILADGMGSGVKANILATLTSKILGTMILNGATIDEGVETVVKTLPVCQVRQIAYSTFSILQIYQDGNAYLVEFDNPSCVFIRNHELVQVQQTDRVIEGKTIHESRFQVQEGDYLILMSDGVIHAGVGQILNFGWTWDSMAEYAIKSSYARLTASRMATVLSKACEDLYMGSPGDDTTVAVARITSRKDVVIFTGPPLNKSDDAVVVEKFMKLDGIKIVSGGTSANIVSRELNRPIHTSLDYIDPDIPPIASIEGIDYVTEGVLTLTRTLTLLTRYQETEVDEDYFEELDKKNGGSLIAKVLLEECTHLTILVGKSINEAHQNPHLPFNLSIRMNLIEQMKDVLIQLGKKVTIEYF